MEANHEINRNVLAMGNRRPDPGFTGFADDLRGGDDWLEGGEGNYYIGTGQGSDVAYGGKGNDVLTAYGTLSTDVCYRQPVDLLTTQRFYYKIAGSEARIYVDHPRLAAFDFEIRPKPATDASGELVFRNVGQPSPSLEAGTELALKLGDAQGVERGESVALNALPNADFGKPIGYPFQLASNSALQATGQKGVRLWGGTGNDIIYGAGDNDKLYGEADNDVLVGFGGDDALYGGAGKDELSGGDGRDFLDGGDDESADTLYGGMGADVIHGGDGDDKMWGDAGIKPYQCTTNSIALRAGFIPAKCLKGLKNRAKTSLQRCTHTKYKPNQPIAHMDTARIATEFVVNS